MTSETSAPVSRRHEFTLFFDVTRGNPNGDPDAGNLPRLDPQTNHGLVSDVCLKRKIRNYVDFVGGLRNEIFVQERRPLNPLIAQAAAENGLPTHAKDNGKWDKDAAKKRPAGEVSAMQRWLCEKFYDIRAFGAVLSTGPNAGQIRGPVQLAFASSVESILPLSQAITRVADVDREEAEMGRKHIVPYGLYRVHGYISAALASHPVKGTGFSEDDLDLFWEALTNMFEHDHSAARGEMASRKLVIFRHATALGSAPAHILFDRVKTWRVHRGSRQEIGSDATDNWPPARSFDDYAITVERAGLPDGVEVLER